ncbi:MAG: tRNA pseudouridine synthase 2 [Chlamydiota bacterium]|jgi:tRNA pseudouridine38-40 synthase
MTRYKLVISYLGTAYTGWQKTECGGSVENQLEKALETILQHDVKLQAASRTDRGVHAKGQVVDFATDAAPKNLMYRLNQLLPHDIAIKHLEEAPPSFHATMDAKGKRYTYELDLNPVQLPIYRKTSWHIPFPLDLQQMEKGAQALLGCHDFSAFCNERALWDRNPVCSLTELSFLPIEDNRLQITLQADHFLYKMARNLVGTLVYVGCGKIPAEELPSLLGKKQRTAIGMTAPAHGLTLVLVKYT